MTEFKLSKVQHYGQWQGAVLKIRFWP